MPTSNIGQYLSKIGDFYKAGKNGTSIDLVPEVDYALKNAEAKRAAYAAGWLEGEHETHTEVILKTPGEIGEKAIPYSQRGIEIEPRLKGYLGKLPNTNSYVSDVKGSFIPQYLSILTAETGVEYTVITVGEKSYLIRGTEKSTTIPADLEEALINNKGTLDYHSHPFIGDLIPSKADRYFLGLLTWQKKSVIIDSTQTAVKFSADGAVEPFKIENDYRELDWNAIFKDGDIND